MLHFLIDGSSMEEIKKTLYIFVDESGNFDFSPKGTKYYTLTSLCDTRPFPSYDGLTELKYDLIEQGLDIESFHAAPDKQPVRDKVYAFIKTFINQIEIDSIIVEKCKVHPKLYSPEKFYPMIFSFLLDFVLSRRLSIPTEKVIVFIDKCKERGIEKGIKTYFRNKVDPSITFHVLHHQSKSNRNLQVVDYINWAIFRKWENKDERSYSIIRDAIKSEVDVLS